MDRRSLLLIPFFLLLQAPSGETAEAWVARRNKDQAYLKEMLVALSRFDVVHQPADRVTLYVTQAIAEALLPDTEGKVHPQVEVEVRMVRSGDLVRYFDVVLLHRETREMLLGVRFLVSEPDEEKPAPTQKKHPPRELVKHLPPQRMSSWWDVEVL